MSALLTWKNSCSASEQHTAFYCKWSQIQLCSRRKSAFTLRVLWVLWNKSALTFFYCHSRAFPKNEFPVSSRSHTTKSHSTKTLCVFGLFMKKYGSVSSVDLLSKWKIIIEYIYNFSLIESEVNLNNKLWFDWNGPLVKVTLVCDEVKDKLNTV